MAYGCIWQLTIPHFQSFSWRFFHGKIICKWWILHRHVWLQEDITICFSDTCQKQAVFALWDFLEMFCRVQEPPGPRFLSGVAILVIPSTVVLHKICCSKQFSSILIKCRFEIGTSFFSSQIYKCIEFVTPTQYVLCRWVDKGMEQIHSDLF